MDRRQSRNAQAVLRRHVVGLDGTCQWCGRPTSRAATATDCTDHHVDDAQTAGADAVRIRPFLGGDGPGARGRNQRRLL